MSEVILYLEIRELRTLDVYTYIYELLFKSCCTRFDDIMYFYPLRNCQQTYLIHTWHPSIFYHSGI